jgi:Tetratricopeptide repeat
MVTMSTPRFTALFGAALMFALVSAGLAFPQNQPSLAPQGSVPTAAAGDQSSGLPPGAENPPLQSGAQGGATPAPPPDPTAGPAWLLLDKGKNAFRDKKFGTALEFFRASIERGGETPEADMWIGRVFEEEGELDLAEDQYNRALANKGQFLIPDESVEILYDLARIYDNTNSWGKYEVTLKRIVTMDTQFTSATDEGTRQAMVRILENDGLDKLLLLYRLDDKKTQDAHSQLGTFDYRTGRYQDAILNLMFSALTIFSSVMERYASENPDWEFTSAADLFAQAKSNPDVSRYLAGSGVFHDLYYLANALYANGKPIRATAIWRLIVQWSPHDTWYRQAVGQIRNPTIEPLLVPGS